MSQGELTTCIKWETIWTELAKLGVTVLRVEFDGREKSAQTEGPYVEAADSITPNEATTQDKLHALNLRIAETVTDIPAISYGYPVEPPRTMYLGELIRDLALDLTYQSNDSWSREDGGFGCVNFYASSEFTECRVEVEMNERFVNIETYESHFDRHGKLNKVGEVSNE